MEAWGQDAEAEDEEEKEEKEEEEEEKEKEEEVVVGYQLKPLLSSCKSSVFRLGCFCCDVTRNHWRGNTFE